MNNNTIIMDIMLLYTANKTEDAENKMKELKYPLNSKERALLEKVKYFWKEFFPSIKKDFPMELYIWVWDEKFNNFPEDSFFYEWEKAYIWWSEWKQTLFYSYLLK